MSQQAAPPLLYIHATQSLIALQLLQQSDCVAPDEKKQKQKTDVLRVEQRLLYLLYVEQECMLLLAYNALQTLERTSKRQLLSETNQPLPTTERCCDVTAQQQLEMARVLGWQWPRSSCQAVVCSPCAQCLEVDTQQWA